MEITVKKLTPELVDTYLYYFEHVGFTDNPNWASCYCYFYSNQWEKGEWEQRTAEENRCDSRAWLESGGLNGYLAFLDGQPVGWCHANDKENLRALTFLPEQPVLEGRTGSIVCFNVAPDHRGKGIATKLLAAACDGLREEGFARVEAYPRKSGGETVQDHYHGPLEMYTRQEFAPTGEFGPYLIVQKDLG